MIILEIIVESGIAWKPTKCNNFNPTKRRLYKGLTHTKLGAGKIGESDSEKNTGKQRGTERNQRKFLVLRIRGDKPSDVLGPICRITSQPTYK